MKFTKLLFASVFASCVAQPGVAQSENTNAPNIQISQQVLHQIRTDPNGFTENAIRRLLSLAPNGELTTEALNIRAETITAQRRAARLTGYLAFDLDGDLEITASEIERQLPYLNTNHSTVLRTIIATADRDRDGNLTLQELWQTSMEASVPGQSHRNNGEELMQFDANRDGTVTPEEIATTVEQIASARISPDVVRPKPTRLDRFNPESLCEFPKPSASAKVILLSGYEGYAISNVAVSGQDRETSAAVIDIEKGEQPLYIVATNFDSLVWQLTGETDRVERFVAPAMSRGVGVVGLDKSKIHFQPGRECLPKYFTDIDSGEALIAKGLVASRLKRNVDKVVGTYKLGEIQLPSGRHLTDVNGSKKAGGLTIVRGNKRYLVTDDGVKLLDAPVTEQTGGLERRLENLLLRYHKGGVMEFSLADVVASNEAVLYDVLPQQAGLLQLAREGAISQTPDGYFRINKPIPRFPAGLNGGHSVKFIISAGVPIPDGSAGHSTVILEETGACISGGMCR